MITINIALPTYLQRVLHGGAHRLFYQHMFRLIHRRGRPSQSHTKHLKRKEGRKYKPILVMMRQTLPEPHEAPEHGGGGEETEGVECV
jgi:hypothetical protein